MWGSGNSQLSNTNISDTISFFSSDMYLLPMSLIVQTVVLLFFHFCMFQRTVSLRQFTQIDSNQGLHTLVIQGKVQFMLDQLKTDCTIRSIQFSLLTQYIHRSPQFILYRSKLFESRTPVYLDMVQVTCTDRRHRESKHLRLDLFVQEIHDNNAKIIKITQNIIIPFVTLHMTQLMHAPKRNKPV